MISFTQFHFDLIACPHGAKRTERARLYFDSLPDKRDRYWAQLLLRNTARTRSLQYDELRQCASAFTGFPHWLIEESIRHTGNVTEAITLIVKSRYKHGNIPLHEVMDKIHALHTQSYDDKEHFIHSVWEILPERSVYLFNKLITAGYRSPLSKREYGQLADSDAGKQRSLHTIKAVLLYASQNEYTFAVWKNDLLIPLVKITYGIPQDELLHIRKFISKNTRERFGPVHSINPELIYEIGFEDVEHAPRRKSGIKLISPHLIRRCQNTALEDIDRLESISVK